MIITQTPLRISFLGGGTDLPAFYREEPGAVLTCTIDKYIYVILKRRFDRRIRIGYTRTELVDAVAEVEHDLVREALRVTGVESSIELATMGDIPSRGSGLGSSSTVTVGLLHALWVHRGVLPSREQLASAACEIEIRRLERPIGKQDQYAAAYGGLRYIRFEPDGVAVSEVIGSTRVRRAVAERLMLFFTGITRQSSAILAEQRDNTTEHLETLRRMRDLADAGRDALGRGDVGALGELLHSGWMYKRELASRITNPEIDDMYQRAREAGAVGGKICGAGGGGFLLLYAEPEVQDRIRLALSDFRELPFGLSPNGTQMLLNADTGSAGLEEVE